MVFHADAKRDRAVARLAKWTGRLDRWDPNSPLGRFAATRRDAAIRDVRHAAKRDVLAGVDADHVGFRVPADRDRAAATFNAIAHYRAAVTGLAGYLDHAAGLRRPAAGEGVPGPQEAPPVRRRLWKRKQS